MTEFNRSGFKATTMSSLEDEKKTAAAAVPSSFSGRAEFHSVIEGKNWFRIAPATKPDEPAYRGMASTFLECEVDEYSDGEKTGKKVVKNKKVFIATQHSASMKTDPVLMYIEYVNKRANDEYTDKNEGQKFLTPIRGYRDNVGKWVWGIDPITSFICYAWDSTGKLGRLELRPKWLDEIKRLSVAANDSNQSIVVDIFTDPDEGYPLTIEMVTKQENKKKTINYILEKDIPNAGKREDWKTFFERVALTDNQLVELMNQESLTELYYDVYTMHDFNLAIDGLRRFDDKYKYGIFENEEFIERLEIMKSTVPAAKETEEDDQPEAPAKVSDKLAAKETVKEESGEVSVVTNIPIPKMKTFIGEYILENYGGDYSMPALTIPQVKEWFQLCKQGMELPFDDYIKNDTEIQQQEEVAAEQPKVEKLDTNTIDETESLSKEDLEMKAKIDELRKKRQQSKNQ